ncbi:hypothetical protein QJS04_geneDACA011404 [Acorus gramineus]|uniref:LisH domain-containing protein n=1 Tax=Acorus gramineus TaxID=55184 RepID=A0AAV9AJF5_ACOGR|nr:hypothetical protein QJS04_geneDACA011404 [Acorus gramineus]
MAKHSKIKRVPTIGKGKVTPVQVAFIVEQYLIDNKFTRTLSIFRAEASLLISRPKNKETPKGLMGLSDILDEYVCLKEQRVVVDMEKQKVETVFKGLNDVMQAYRSSSNSSPPKTPSLEFTPQADKSVTPTKSSETIVASQFKSIGYYSVEKSYSISSPSKSNILRPCIRDHVKGRLNFDNSDVSSSQVVEVNALEQSAPQTDAEMEEEMFDIDIPNFDVLDADFSFSEFLANMDVPSYSNCGEMIMSSEPVSNPFDNFIPGYMIHCTISIC